MKKLVTSLAVGLLIVGAQSLMAQTSTNSTPSTTPGAHQGQGRERMAAILKLLDLNPADMKSLTPEERRAKMKERAEKIVADLQAKQTAGTLSTEGQTRLEKVQKFLANAGKHKAGAAPSTGTTPPSSNSQ